MKTLLLLITITFTSISLLANGYLAIDDTAKNKIQNIKLQFKVAEGTTQFYSYNYRGALNTFREVLSIDEHNAGANYGIAQCQYALGKVSLAEEYADKAYKTKPNVDKGVLLLLGNIEHRLANLDKAISYFEGYKKTLKGNKNRILESDVDLYIAQCKYAQQEMKTPKNVTVKNIGDKINSAAPEFAPCISQDGKTLLFTSRRSDTKGGQVDKNFDFQYYTDVYMSTLDSVTGQWTKGKNVGGKINTDFHDGALGFMPNGSMLIYRNIMKVTGSGDIYVSKKSKSGRWGNPKPLLEKEDKKISNKINSSYFESSASVTADGKAIYFVSERPGGLGRADIYEVVKTKTGWAEPKNIGENINTPNDEKCVFVSLDGTKLYFSSNGYKNSLGSYDIYLSEKQEDGTWGEAKNLGYPINTVKEEKTVSVSPDGKTLYISAYYDKDNLGSADIYTIDISNLK